MESLNARQIDLFDGAFRVWQGQPDRGCAPAFGAVRLRCGAAGDHPFRGIRGEEAHGVSADEFERLERQGAFALCWRANGLAYGIPVQIDEWLASGRHVLINGSRAYLDQARQRYPQLLAILLTVDIDVLRQRLMNRGRESATQIEARLKRSALFLLTRDLCWENPCFSGQLERAVRDA